MNIPQCIESLQVSPQGPPFTSPPIVIDNAVGKIHDGNQPARRDPQIMDNRLRCPALTQGKLQHKGPPPLLEHTAQEQTAIRPCSAFLHTCPGSPGPALILRSQV
jgi:hypothetical protein